MVSIFFKYRTTTAIDETDDQFSSQDCETLYSQVRKQIYESDNFIESASVCTDMYFCFWSSQHSMKKGSYIMTSRGEGLCDVSSVKPFVLCDNGCMVKIAQNRKMSLLKRIFYDRGRISQIMRWIPCPVKQNSQAWQQLRLLRQVNRLLFTLFSGGSISFKLDL